MKSLPNIPRKKIIEVYEEFVQLYSGAQTELLKAAERALSSDPNPFNIVAGASVSSQLDEIKNRMQRSAFNYGRNLLISWIEELHTELVANGGAHGVTLLDFINSCRIKVENNVIIKLTSDRKWQIEWELPSDEDSEQIAIHIRNISISNDDIVPDYIIQYVWQSIIAYNNKNYLTSLALISIALEGTLRDALELKGYTYNYGAQVNDVYSFEEMEVYPDVNGFQVKFANAMPRNYNDFLTESGKVVPEKIRIKRFKNGPNWRMELRDIDYLKDFWSTDNIVTPATGSINIGGLGTALNVARNQAGILTNSILPADTDDVFQKVRNNLIHLSGAALTTPIASVGGISLEEFTSSRSRIFDAIWSICGTVDQLYIRISNGTL